MRTPSGFEGADARERVRSRTTRRRRRVGSSSSTDVRHVRCEERSPRIGSGEMFFAPRLAVEGFTTRAGSRETRTGQLVAYARSIDRGYGLEGWDGTEDPAATAFRDGAADVVGGRGEPDRVDTGLVVFTGDASHCSVAQDLDDDVVGLPGAYKRGRAATFSASHACVNGCFKIKTKSDATRERGRRRVHAHVRRG